MTVGSGIAVERLAEWPTDDEVGEIVDLERLVNAELDPGDPPVSFGEVAGRLRHPVPRHVTTTWVAHQDNELVGLLTAMMDTRSANAGFVELEQCYVRPDRRRRGVGTALLRVAAPVLVDQGAETIMGWACDDAGIGFCEAAGLTARQEERMSRLDVAAVDVERQDSWIAAERAHSAGYRVVSWTGPAPDEHLDAWARALDAMADAPLDDIEWQHDPVTPEWVREIEAMSAVRGWERVASLALSVDGEAAGMSLILVHPERLELVHQEDTAVVPTHRGFALGRWLKAANLRQLVELHPEVRIVETYNAESNGPMLDINVAMGFRPWRTYLACQASIDAVRASLA